jgi:hypothetical protein
VLYSENAFSPISLSAPFPYLQHLFENGAGLQRLSEQKRGEASKINFIKKHHSNEVLFIKKEEIIDNTISVELDKENNNYFNCCICSNDKDSIVKMKVPTFLLNLVSFRTYSTRLALTTTVQFL